jgi:DNA invertase Pin-like site-specific DNA recombinase
MKSPNHDQRAPRAIGYIRRSTERQDESLEQQRTQLTAFAAARGWELAAIFEDDAISGSEMSRPGLDRLRHAAKDPAVQIVLAWDRNRLSRPKDPIDGVLLEREFQNAGKRVVYAATGQEADRSFASNLISFVEHYQNGDYLRKLSRDTMRGTVDRARRGLWAGGPTPFGFDRLILSEGEPKRIVRDREDGGQTVLDASTGNVLDELPLGKPHKKQEHEVSTLIPSVEARVRAVRGLFGGYASGIPTRRLRDQLNAAGFRTSRGSAFTIPTLLPILENPAYIGRCVYNRRTLSKWHKYTSGGSVERSGESVEKRDAEDWITCDDAWPALVERATFDEVQRRRAESRTDHATPHRGNAMKSDYLLTGKLVCAVCGGKLTGCTTTSGRGIRTRGYVCSFHQRGFKDRCPKRYTVPADLVERYILDHICCDLRRLHDDQQLQESIEADLRRLHGAAYDALEQNQRLLQSLDQKLANLREHLSILKPASVDALGLYDRIDDLQEERAEVESKIRTLVDRGSLPPMSTLRARIVAELQAVEQLVATGTVEERRRLIGFYVKEIQADPNRGTVRIGLYPTLLSQRIEGG